MHKIVSLFKRDYDGDRLAYDEVTPGAEWVVAGEGTATRKFDGTCCLIRDGRFYKRFSCRERKKMPQDFLLEERVEQKTRRGEAVVKLYGWVPVGDGPEDKYHREALSNPPQANDGTIQDGTYELCGPKVQGDAEHLPNHTLIRHGAVKIEDAPRTFDELKAWFKGLDIEGIVWHHADGRMVKIKKKDFGLERGD